MTLDFIIRTAINPAMAMLPADMDTPQARVQLLAIGLQESRFVDRRQLVGSPPQPTGPAKSFWQAEQGGGMVHGVRRHAATSRIAAELCKARNVSPNDRAVWNAIENDDVLAAALARLLLWTDPQRLPKLGDAEGAWQLYLRTWRPGAYERGIATERATLRNKWTRNYALALEAMAGVAA
ncbi:MAG: hypothetical protein WBF95_09155 [Comamonas thiooxydans]